MKRFIPCLALLVAMFTIAGQAHGLIIHESAILGTTDQDSGLNISSVQFLGSRFHIDTTTEVTHIGGHMGINFGDLFGAIVSLSGPNALPSGNPFDSSEVVASTKFDPGSPSSDFLTPLSVTLSAGDYALIFGSMQFGAVGQGFMTTNNSDITRQASYFRGNNSGSWADVSISGTRFVVASNPTAAHTPEPTTLCLISFGLLGVSVVAIRRRRKMKL
jgi:hypothetical protein